MDYRMPICFYHATLYFFVVTSVPAVSVFPDIDITVVLLKFTLAFEAFPSINLGYVVVVPSILSCH